MKIIFRDSDNKQIYFDAIDVKTQYVVGKVLDTPVTINSKGELVDCLTGKLMAEDGLLYVKNKPNDFGVFDRQGDAWAFLKSII